MDDRTKDLIEKVKISAKKVGDLTLCTASVVGKKASNAVEHGKLEMKILNVKNELDLLYKNIGKELYEARMNPEVDAADFDELFAAVDEKSEELKELYKQKDELHNSK